jgi:hypothetical protein
MYSDSGQWVGPIGTLVALGGAVRLLAMVVLPQLSDGGALVAALAIIAGLLLRIEAAVRGRADYRGWDAEVLHGLWRERVVGPVTREARSRPWGEAGVAPAGVGLWSTRI